MSDNSNISLNLVPNDPTLSDLLDLFRKEIFLDLNCHHLATVQDFDPATQTVTCTINYQKTIFQLNEQSQQYSAVLFNYPPLAKVPVVILSGGKSGVTFPIVQGDQCLLMFNDRSIDNWYQSGQVGPVAQSRYHSFSDAIALVGIRNLNTVLGDFDTDRASLFNGQTKVAVGESLILLTNAEGQSLGILMNNLTQALTNLITQLTTAFATPAAIGSPLDPGWSAAIAPVSMAISQLQTQLGDLLE